MRSIKCKIWTNFMSAVLFVVLLKYQRVWTAELILMTYNRCRRQHYKEKRQQNTFDRKIHLLFSLVSPEHFKMAAKLFAIVEIDKEIGVFVKKKCTFRKMRSILNFRNIFDWSDGWNELNLRQGQRIIPNPNKSSLCDLVTWFTHF